MKCHDFLGRSRFRFVPRGGKEGEGERRKNDDNDQEELTDRFMNVEREREREIDRQRRTDRQRLIDS